MGYLRVRISSCDTVVDLTANALFVGFQADTRAALPGWDGLLYVYGILFVPVFFTLLVGLNLQVWSATRINYVFIFGAFLPHHHGVGLRLTRRS